MERLGSLTFGHLDIDGDRMITIEFPRASEIQVGDALSVKGNVSNVNLFSAETGMRLN